MKPVYEPKIHRRILDADHYGGVMTEHLGLILHVAEGNGSLHDYFARTVSPNRKSSTWWVGKSGLIEKYVPTAREAWAQGEGNGTYNSVETEGYSTEEFTLFQLAGLSYLYRRGTEHLKWRYLIADKPGERGLGVHSMGGDAWGGHPCPGSLRTNERHTILNVAEGRNCKPAGLSLTREIEHFKRTHGLPDNAVIGPRVRALLSL